MAYSFFTIDQLGPVAHLCLNRPKSLNALSAEFWNEFPAAIKELDATGNCRALVISAQGPHFTAGIDLALLADKDKPIEQKPSQDIGRLAEHMRRWILALQETFNLLEKARMPVLVATQGGCIGGGIDLISACDMRYCTEDAFFCIKETAVGITADLGTLQRLPHIIPQGLVRELAYTARNMDAQEALSAGLVNHVYPDQQTMLEGVMAIAEKIAQHSPLAVAGTKVMLNYTRDHSVADSLDYMATWQNGMFQGLDTAHSLKAMQEKSLADYENLLPVDDSPTPKPSN